MMRLRRLNLDFFGNFAGKSFDFGERVDGRTDFHVLYGPNEAGKTTMMEGFLRLLYGFPLRENYSFKHQRANLKVSGALEISGTSQQFTRLPRRANSLLNASGAPVPETTLQGALGGLSIDDYRKLLCLDDATIEEGGDEIANSRGDIGRLLFSAAAGVSDLSVVLDEVEQQASGFYKKGGSKTVFAQLKREFDDLASQIRELDVTAAGYRKLKQGLEVALAEENSIREERREALRQKSHLHSFTTALPIFEKLSRLEKELAPISHYPPALDIDPEELVAMLTKKVQRVSESNRLENSIYEKTTARDAITLQPELVSSIHELEALKELRGRYDTANIDLPKRRLQRDDSLEDMRGCLVEIGISDTDAPERYVLPEPALADLERKLQDLRDAEKAHKTATEEENDVAARLEDAEKAFKNAKDTAEDGPDLKVILDRYNAPRVLEQFNKASNSVGLAKQGYRDALAKLTYKGQIFVTVPAIPLTTAEAAKLARDIDKASQEVEIRRQAFVEAGERCAQLHAQITIFESSADLVTDEEATTSRAERDTLWQIHLRDLAQPSAVSFEIAMRADDGKMAVRQSLAKDLGELRQIKLNLADAESKRVTAQSHLNKATGSLATLTDQLNGFAAIVGLPDEPTPDALSDWIRHAETASTAKITLEQEREESVEAISAAKILCEVLVAALEEEDGELDALVTMARERADVQAENQRLLRSAKETFEASNSELVRRRKLKANASDSLDNAQSTWAQSIKNSFGDNPNEVSLKESLPVLRRLREINERLIAAQRQIDGMKNDQSDFVIHLNAILDRYDELKRIPPEKALDTLEEMGSVARSADEKWQTLNKEIEAATKRLAEVKSALTTLDGQVKVLASCFDSSIPTERLEELRTAVQVGKQAIEMRLEMGDLTQQLISTLKVKSRAEAGAALADQTIEETRAKLSEVELDLATLESRMTAAIEIRTKAETALNAITGDSDVAARVVQKRTIEVEMQAGTMRYLENRFGHMITDQAIRLYRDKHRSGMMRVAEKAFSQLTNGAYMSLTTQPDGASEALVAIQESDGAAKQVHAMSKGTRFQLYLALRAAAYEQMATNGTILPFFCDDVFETFDEARTRAACGLMHQIGQTGQAIYLTHHMHVVDIAKDVCSSEVTIHKI